MSSVMRAGLCYLSQRANLDCVHGVASRESAAGSRYVRTNDLWVDQDLSEAEQSGFVLQAAQEAVCRKAAFDQAFRLNSSAGEKEGETGE